MASLTPLARLSIPYTLGIRWDGWLSAAAVELRISSRYRASNRLLMPMRRFIRRLAVIGMAVQALASISFAQTWKVAQGNAEDLGVMGVSLKDAVKLNYGIQAQLQGAGTPNEAGIGGFLPLRVGKQSVSFLDVLANVNFADYPGYSSIINTTVAGGTISTSTRLGHRWLNGDRSWMYGFNFGYDSRPMATGPADTGVNVSSSQTVFFQQMAFNAEAVSNKWSANGYWLVPVGQYGWGNSTVPVLNSNYVGDSLMTVGLDVAYSLTSTLKASVGYYYQDGDLNNADASGIQLKAECLIANGLALGGKLSYDPIYNTVVSGNIKYRFRPGGHGALNHGSVPTGMTPLIRSISSMPANRDVRVADLGIRYLSPVEIAILRDLGYQQ